MINKLRRKVTSKKLSNGGGIKSLPLPPSSPNVPQVFNQAPLFSKLGLQQRYAALPGAIRTPISKTGKFLGLRNPYMLGLYGLSYAAQNPTISNFMSNFPGSDFDREYAERMAKEAGPAIDAQTIIDKINSRNQNNLADGKSVTLQELGISPLVDAQKKLATDITEVADGSVPIEPGTNVLANSVIDRIQDNTGITLPKDGGNIVRDADANDGFLSTPGPEKGVTNNEQITEDSSNPPDGPVVDATDEEIDTEYTNRSNQNSTADQTYYDNYFAEILKSGRSAEALALDAQVRDIMGPESKKSKNLLLLQLAANLVTGRTDQPGFKGFIDVLGQAGKATIPMAIALEEQRREDERELKKALINARAKKQKSDYKRGKIEGLAVFLDENGERRKGPLRYDSDGNAIVTVTDPNGQNPREKIVNGRIITTMKFPDAKQKQEIISEIRMYSRAVNGAREVLDIITRDPSITGSPGTVKRAILRIGDIAKAYAGKLDFSELRADLNLAQQHFGNTMAANRSLYSSDDEFNKVLEAGNKFFEKQMKELRGVQGSESTLEQQAKIRSIQLFTSYALANILKNKDRLAVQDIRRAEEITENFKLLGSPTDIIFAYKELQDQLQEALRDKIEFADSIGVSDAQINQLRFQVEGDAAKRKRIDESLDQFIAQALDGYTSLDDLLDKLNFGELEIINQDVEYMGAQSG